MVQVTNLTKTFATKVLFKDCSFTIAKGQRVGLVGKNGSGKTTLFKILLAEEHYDSGTITVPSNYKVATLPQHIHFEHSSIIKEACLSIPPSPDGVDTSYLAKKILLGLGFALDSLNQSPQTLSGGFQIRLALARVLLQAPDLLLLDEPTNYLDITSLRWLSSFLRSWQKELILITHDRQFMDSVCTHTMIIHRQKIIKAEGGTEKLYKQIALQEQHYEQTRLNELKKRQQIQEFIDRFRAKATKASAVQSRIKLLEKLGTKEALQSERILDFAFRYAHWQGKWLLDAQDISFGYDKPLFLNFSITVGSRDRIAIVGANGKGKSTLLRLFAGELTTQTGSIKLHPKAEIGYFAQTNVMSLNPANTIEDEVLACMPDANRKFARTLCGIMMFEGDDALKKISVLSGGEKSRVMLAKILAKPVNLLLLDEPTNHLDIESVDALIEALDDFEGAVIIVTHNELVLNALAERLIVFDRDTVRVYEGTYSDFLAKVGWSSEAEVEAKTPTKAQSAKDIRRLKAEIINEKSRELGSLKRQISEIEDEIVRLEAVVSQNNEIMLANAHTGNYQALIDANKKVQSANKEIEALFARLQDLTDKLNQKEAYYSKRLQALT